MLYIRLGFFGKTGLAGMTHKSIEKCVIFLLAESASPGETEASPRYSTSIHVSKVYPREFIFIYIRNFSYNILVLFGPTQLFVTVLIVPFRYHNLIIGN